MSRIVTGCVAATLGAVLAGGLAEAQDMQQKVAAAKQAAAQNQQVLRGYTWVEKTEIALKGEVKNTKLQSCRYGPDGKVQKTPLSEPAPPAQESGGRGGRRGGRVKRKVVEKKTGELKEDMEAAVALVHQYVPPAPDKIQAAMGAGRITLSPGAATTTLRIADYVKPGDALVLALDASGKGMKQLNVDTWKDAPADKVALKVDMQSLPDGTSYPGVIVLSVPASNVEVRITNSNYQKLAQ
jgi:hypothetical protein